MNWLILPVGLMVGFGFAFSNDDRWKIGNRKPIGWTLYAIGIVFFLFLVGEAQAQQVEEREYSRSTTLADEVYRLVQNKTQDERILEYARQTRISFQILQDDPRADHRVQSGGGNTRVEHRQGHSGSKRISGRVTFPGGSQYVPASRTFRENYRETNAEHDFGNKYLARILRDNRIRIDSRKEDGRETEAVKAVTAFANDIANEIIRRYAASGTQAVVERTGASQPDVEGISQGDFEFEVIRPATQSAEPIRNLIQMPAGFKPAVGMFFWVSGDSGDTREFNWKCNIRLVRDCGNGTWEYQVLASHNNGRPTKGDEIKYQPGR